MSSSNTSVWVLVANTHTHTHRQLLVFHSNWSLCYWKRVPGESIQAQSCSFLIPSAALLENQPNHFIFPLVKTLQCVSEHHTHLLEWWARSKWLQSPACDTPISGGIKHQPGQFVTHGWHTCLSQYEVQQGKQETVKHSRLLLAKLSEWPRAPGTGGYDCCCHSRHFLKKTRALDHTWSPGALILSPAVPRLMSVAYNPTQNTPIWLLTSTYSVQLVLKVGPWRVS